MKTYFPLVFLTVLALAACKNPKHTDSSSTLVKPEDVEFIEFGSSFGFCRGYCKRWVTFTKTEAVYHELGHDTVQFPLVSIKENSNIFESLVQQMNWKSWDTLGPNIGCPDCTDAGAEYIVVKTAKSMKKVRFDSGSNPEALGNVVARMRFVREKMNKKMHNPEE